MEISSHEDSRSHSSSSITKGKSDNNLIFVGGLPAEACNLHLKQYFGRFGTLLKAEIRYSDVGKSKGYGFILYSDPADLELMLACQPHQILGKNITVERAHDQSKKLTERISVTNRKVFIGGIPAWMSVPDILSLVSKLAKIVKISKPRHKKTDGTQYCVAFLESEMDAQKLLNSSPIKIGKSAAQIFCTNYIPPKLKKPQQQVPNSLSLAELIQPKLVSLNKTISLRQITNQIQPFVPVASFTEGESESQLDPLLQKMAKISVVPKSITIRRRLRLEVNEPLTFAQVGKQNSSDQAEEKQELSISPLLKENEGYRFNLRYSPKRTRSAQK
jgi:RNA recognition motif-containing protein